MRVRKRNQYYIAMLSVHGLVRGDNIELGRDADTGGQVQYVIDLARALSDNPHIDRVDLFTRQVIDKRVDREYAEPLERLAEKSYLVRIPCGPRRYLRKEALWPYLDEFADNILHYFRNLGRVPDFIHGHYADAGLVGAGLANVLGAPLIFTGHSLGLVKRERLSAKGMPPEAIEKRYNIGRRIEAEEIALDTAAHVIASTQQEVASQYSRYANSVNTRATVIPPGVQLARFSPPRRNQPLPAYAAELNRFLENPAKPIILALSRPDERKNVETLLKAYAETPGLREQANLVLLLGNRENIEEMDAGARQVLTDLLLAVDRYDLYGKTAYPKHHQPEDVPNLYRLAARSKGVFVNPALTEPFGLTLIEAAACGLPIVATHDGGPQEIIANCRNGRLIDPLDGPAMGQTLREVLGDERQWNVYAHNGLRNTQRHYTWAGHVKRYIGVLKRIRVKWRPNMLRTEHKSRLPLVTRFLITDLDGTLFGDRQAIQELMEKLQLHEKRVAFGIATGRRLESALEALREWKVPTPDILITAVGSEIHYGQDARQDYTWRRHIAHRWEPEKIRSLMKTLPGVRRQPASEQRGHKISYYLDPRQTPSRREIVALLRRERLAAQVITSHERFLDLLPIRASKGRAVRYLALKWGVPFENIIVAGDSGNDEDMLKGRTLGVVVGNHNPELDHLRDRENVYFARRENAGGILEGIEHFRFMNPPTSEEQPDDSRS